jgi:glutaredoxin
MIFESLYKHAKTMVEEKATGEEAFILNEVKIDKEKLKNRVNDAKNNGKISVPVVFLGKKETLSLSRLKISNSGNASNSTFKKLKLNDLPSTYFPWATQINKLEEKKKIGFPVSDFMGLIDRINNATYEVLGTLFQTGGALASFDHISSEELDEKVAKTICLPVSCKNPKGFSHIILGLNALFNIADENDRLSQDLWGEPWRFALLFWVLDKAEKHIELKTEDGRHLEIKGFDVQGGGTVGDILTLSLTCKIGELVVGEKISRSNHYKDPVFSRWAGLAVEETPDSIVLGNKCYSAFPSGKSPTNCTVDEKGKNILGETVRKGFEDDRYIKVLDGYTPLIQETSLNLDDNLYYYVFPDSACDIKEYLNFTRQIIKNIKTTKDLYFKAIKTNSGKREEKLKEIKEKLALYYRDFWSDLRRIKLNDLMFSFEENVGSTNQRQYTWTSAYHGQPMLRIFLLLYLLNSPEEEFNSLQQMLKSTSQSMGATWTGREKRYLIDTFLLKRNIDPGDYWLRWRKYLTRSDASEKPEDQQRRQRLWETSMSFLMSLKAINAIENPELCKQTGDKLFENFRVRRNIMTDGRKEEILKYLKELFRPEEPYKEENKSRIKSMLDRCSDEYASFVDTDSENWKPIVDGLVCGWGLKAVCRKLREENYQSIIGGRSLIRQQPDEVRTLTIDLLEKVSRSGESVWLVEIPLEIMFSWSGKKTTTDEKTRLFMDSLAFGFMRFNGFSRKINSASEEEDK